jgi:hypothetical protein
MYRACRIVWDVYTQVKQEAAAGMEEDAFGKLSNLLPSHIIQSFVPQPQPQQRPPVRACLPAIVRLVSVVGDDGSLFLLTSSELFRLWT